MFASFFKDSRHRKNNSTAVLSEVLLSCLLQLALAGRLALPLKLLHTAAAASKFCVELLTSQQNLRISQGNSPSFHNKASKLNMTCKTYSERKKDVCQPWNLKSCRDAGFRLPVSIPSKRVNFIHKQDWKRSLRERLKIQKYCNYLYVQQSVLRLMKTGWFWELG